MLPLSCDSAIAIMLYMYVAGSSSRSQDEGCIQISLCYYGNHEFDMKDSTLGKSKSFVLKTIKLQEKA